MGTTGKKNTAKSIVDAIIEDLTDRRGLRQEWDMIDSEIKREIRSTWRKKVQEILDAK